uniref:Uncharacterized protein n=2 Tax=Ralstonia solanacearum species complex TaxID=3116862 RepID=A0A0S4W5N4_RALSL|nr:conserved protein of unknown function [Ralstonia solanacearum]
MCAPQACGLSIPDAFRILGIQQAFAGACRASYSKRVERFTRLSGAPRICPQDSPSRLQNLPQPIDAKGFVARCNSSACCG